MLSLVVVYVGLAVLAPLCAAAQRLLPAREGVPGVARDRGVDWLYWLVTPLLSGLVSRALVVALGALAAMALGGEIEDADAVLAFFAERSVLRALPDPAQLVVGLLVVDLLSYWSHRLRHHPLFFPLHAVHHSAEQLDWLAAARMHPLDEIVDNVVITVPFLFLGPAPWVLLVLGPITLLYTLISHAAVSLPAGGVLGALRWVLGALRWVLVGPAFHRVHHADDVPGVNYAGMFSIWDRAFGTYRDPSTLGPLRFGLGAEHLPPTLSAHLVRPVRRFLFGDAG